MPDEKEQIQTPCGCAAGPGFRWESRAPLEPGVAEQGHQQVQHPLEQSESNLHTPDP
jgi:hypothetical protein